MNLLPQNFTGLRTLAGRLSQGLFAPDKELTRVGLAARPSDFAAAKNPVPAGTTLQVGV